jgi:hypothetical protein
MIYLLLLLATLTTWATPTKFDVNGGIQGRTLPAIGAELYAEGGYNFLVWGKKEQPKDVLYGLIRPSVGGSTSAVVNSVKGEIEFFPISIFGFVVGRQYLNSNYEFPFLECQEVTCTGEFVRNYIENKMVIGHKGWVLTGNYKIDTLRSPNKNEPMADWRNVLVGEAGEEVQIEKKLLVAKFFSNKMLGVMIENVQFQGSGERKEGFTAVYQERRDKTNYMLGLGAFHTDQQPMGVQLYFRIHHVALPSLKLF